MSATRIGFRRAAWTSAWLSGLFLILYGATNHLTAFRSDVGVMAFGWERHIPFVSLMIVPYLSIDAFFVLAPFLCRDDREVRVLSRRIVLALVVAAACFLLLPLRFSFDRPTTPGLLGNVFDWFRKADLPYNQLPSLHMALRTILASHYAAHTRGGVKWAVAVWFVLIGLSTVLTYQHHVVDVVGGVLLGVLCVHAFPDADATTERRVGNPRVGNYYLLAASIAAAGAVAILASAAMPYRAIAFLPLYAALACGVVGAAYHRSGGAVYRKSRGRLHWSSRVLLAPVIAGQHLSLRHYARKSNRWDVITDCVWLGRHLSDAEAREARQLGVVAVLDLTCEFGRPRGWGDAAYLNVAVLDLTPPTEADLDRAVAFIREHVARGVVYVHCKAGYSRSAVVVGVYLLREGVVTTAEAAGDYLRSRRPGIVLRPEVAEVLKREAARVMPAGR